MRDLRSGRRIVAEGAGAHVAWERGVSGVNPALIDGWQYARVLEPTVPIAFLLGDLPFLDPDELDDVFGQFERGDGPMFVRDHKGTGTTMLLTAGTKRPKLAFGSGSARAHERLGYRAARGSLDGARRDIDTLDDLQAGRSARPSRQQQPDYAG